jgi:hypothetical protein
MNQLSERYLEDFAVGQTFGSGRRIGRSAKSCWRGDAQRSLSLQKTQSANHQSGPLRRQSIEADSACRAEKAMRRSR